MSVSNPLFINANSPDIDIDNIQQTIYALLPSFGDNLPIDYLLQHECIQDIDIDVICNNYKLIVCDPHMLKIQGHRNFINIVNTQTVRRLNKNNLLIDSNDVQYILILQCSTSQFYPEIFKQSYNMRNIIDIMHSSIMYNGFAYYPFKKKVINMLMNATETLYWNLPDKLQFSFNEFFYNRSYINSSWKMNSNIHRDVTNENTNTEDNYDNVHNVTNRNLFYNMTNKHNTYCDYNDISKLEINDIFNQCDNEMKYYLLNALLLTNKYCHLVINNKELLENAHELFKRYAIVFRYTFGYALLTLNLATHSSKNTAHIKNAILDIDTANKLPYFPYAVDDIKSSPYIPALIDDILYKDYTRYIHPQLSDYGEQCFGVCTLNEFKLRFNVFSTCSATHNQFNGLNWNNICVTGSSVLACAQKNNPHLFEDAYLSPNVTHEAVLNSYFNKYYPRVTDDANNKSVSDIDIIYHDKSIMDFYSKGCEIADVMTRNHLEQYCTEKVSDINIAKKVTILVDSKYIFEMICKDVANVVNNINNKYVVKKFYDIYTNEKKKIIDDNKWDTNMSALHNNIPENASIDNVNIIITDNQERNYKYERVYDDEIIYNNNDLFGHVDDNFGVLRIVEVIKFSITNDVYRNVDLFRVPSNDPFSTILKFHLPIVMALYDGNNVYCTIPQICAMMTSVNCIANCANGKKSPCEINHKFMERGFSVLLNKRECDIYDRYEARNNNIVSKFKPTNTHEINSVAELKEYYRNIMGKDSDIVNMLAIKTINEHGYINSVNKWAVNAMYDILT
jgi:hypothetical protein